jgi:predicted ABC-type ATPase
MLVPMPPPNLYVVAGPNGAGKSTLPPELVAFSVNDLRLIFDRQLFAEIEGGPRAK